jgi:hypothetical protein
METPKEVIREIEHAKPGQRFQRLYRERQGSPHGALKNWLFVGAGLATIALGVAAYAIPIFPSDIVILIGIALLAQGSGWGARALDHAELFFRRHFGWLIAKWKKLPRPAKWTIYAVWLGSMSGLSWWIYRSVG